METKENIISRLKAGSASFNTWRTQNPDIPIDLSNSDLSGMDLSDCFLMNANLEYANLSNTTCVSTVFCRANLNKASFENAILFNACFGPPVMVEAKFMFSPLGRHLNYGANLSYVNFKNANMENANCIECNLEYANFENTKTVSANFKRANLEGTLLI